jgi:hypothetical protein
MLGGPAFASRLLLFALLLCVLVTLHHICLPDSHSVSYLMSIHLIYPASNGCGAGAWLGALQMKEVYIKDLQSSANIRLPVLVLQSLSSL